MYQGKLGRFDQLILRRRIPHTLFSWRFLLPGQSLSVRLHRSVFLHAWAQFPRWVWGMVWIYSSLKWLGWYSWKQVVASYRGYSQRAKSRYGVSLPRQLIGLLNLALLHGILPMYYYRYGLFRRRQDPFAYIYTHELPHWHRAMSPGPDVEASIDLLGDKEAFARTMSALEQPVIETLALYDAAEDLSREKIFAAQSLFFKPLRGSQMRGCFALVFDAGADEYCLEVEADGEIISGEDEIFDYIRQQVSSSTCFYIVQRLLQNHPDIEALCKPEVEGLVTLRVVSAHDGEQAEVISAIVEIPAGSAQGWDLHRIDLHSGVMMPQSQLWKPQPDDDGDEENGDILSGRKLPMWRDVTRVVCRAHQHFEKVAAIGWDIAITPDGVVIIEGNFNWRVDMEQFLGDAPLLKTGLEEIYRNRLGMMR